MTGAFFIKTFPTVNWLFTSTFISSAKAAEEWSDSNTGFENTKMLKFKLFGEIHFLRLYKYHKRYYKFKEDSLEIVNYPSHIELLK